MSLKTLLMPWISRRLLSPERLLARRARAERRRLARGAPHEVQVFMQADDPYSALLAQALPALAARYDIVVQAHLVGPPSDEAAPERARLVAYGRADAARLAPALGLWFVDPGVQPEAQAVARAEALLAQAIGEGRFVERAGEISMQLWRGRLAGAQDAPPVAASQMAALEQAGNALRERLGHYLGAMLHYGGEWYWGVDRLHHLERRLQELGARRPGVSGLLFAPPEDLQQAVALPRPSAIEFFVSLRSPYSAIVTPRVFALARLTGAAVHLRPVLPMVMRGLPVPAAKKRYIREDAAREARLRGIPFGCVNDPVGRPTERGLAVLAHAERAGRGPQFLSAFMHGVWAEGVDAGSDRGLARIARAAGLDWDEARAALGDEAWRAAAEANRREMFDLGLWGVPSFRVGELAVWGQDRLWMVQQELLRLGAMPDSRAP